MPKHELITWQVLAASLSDYSQFQRNTETMTRMLSVMLYHFVFTGVPEVAEQGSLRV